MSVHVSDALDGDHIRGDDRVDIIVVFIPERNIITTAGVTSDKLTRIVVKSDTGLEQAVGVLDTLAAGFRAAADIYRGETPNLA